MRESQPFQDEGIGADAENPAIIIPGTSGGYEHIDIPLGDDGTVDQGTIDAYASMVKASFPQDGEAVSVGENLIIPSTSGRMSQTEHIDLPIGDNSEPNYGVYKRMVERPGFPQENQNGHEQIS